MCLAGAVWLSETIKSFVNALRSATSVYLCVCVPVKSAVNI